jgi:hypothetical protein
LLLPQQCPHNQVPSSQQQTPSLPLLLKRRQRPSRYLQLVELVCLVLLCWLMHGQKALVQPLARRLW